MIFLALKCDNCGSNDVAKKGFRYNKIGKKQKYFCHACGSWFVPDDGFKKMRHLPEDVVRAVHLHDDGLSLSKVQNQMWQHDGVKVTRWTIAEWHKKFGVFLKSAKRTSHASNKRASSL